MTDLKFESEPQGNSSYLMSVGSADGTTSLTITLARAAEVSDGVLADDEPTARATFAYLLTHQDASDLPPIIELGDVVAAYADAVEAISTGVAEAKG